MRQICEILIFSHVKEKNMESGTIDQLAGKFHNAVGKLKEAVGVLSGDPKLKASGINEKIAGKVQEKIGQIKKVLGQ